MTEGITWHSIELSEAASRALDDLLRGQDPHAVARFKFLAMRDLAALRMRESSIMEHRPKRNTRKRLLKQYQSALELLSTPHLNDPYGTVWQELEAELIAQNFSPLPNRKDVQKAIGTLAIAARAVAERPGRPGHPPGRKGLGAAMDATGAHWRDCFGSDPTTSNSSPFVRAVKIILDDLEGEPHNLETVRSVVRPHQEQDDLSSEELHEALKYWPVIGYRKK